MELITLQILLAIAMFVATAIAGLLPIKMLHIITKKKDAESKKASWCLTLLSCFAGGVFMSTCFLDIFPHLNGNYVKFREKAGWKKAYPLPEFFVCCGFFIVYFLEEISLRIFASIGESHHHGYSHSTSSSNCNHNQDRLEKPCLQEPLKVYPQSITQYNGYHTEDSRKLSLVLQDDNQSNKSNISNSEKYLTLMTHEIITNDSVRHINNNSETEILKSITFAIAMSFHSILEGFALGVQDNSAGIRTLFISLLIHKGIEAFSVGLQISKSNSKKICMVAITIIIYALMTPFGSIIGLIITNMNINKLLKDSIVIFLEGLAGGTFIYVTFFEVLAREKANKYSNLIQLNAIIIGFLVIASLQYYEHVTGLGHSHGH